MLQNPHYLAECDNYKRKHVVRNFNSFCYILAVGKNKQNINKFYINIENNFLSLEETSFIKVFDYFIKIHRVFDLNYFEELKECMDFLEIFFYEFEDRNLQLTETMKKIHDCIFD